MVSSESPESEAAEAESEEESSESESESAAAAEAALLHTSSLAHSSLGGPGGEGIRI